MKNTYITSMLVGIALFMSIPTNLFALTQPQWVIDSYEAHKYQTLAYRLLRPINFDATQKYPLVITLHNGPAMSDSTQIKAYNIVNLRIMNRQFAEDSMRLKYPAYILAPQVNSMWNKSHLNLCKDIIASLPNVDMNRIYVMGQSMGGMGTYNFIEADPQYFAAAIACSGLGDTIKIPTLANFNLWALHGATDTTVPYTTDSLCFETMKKANGKMKFTTFVKWGHSCEMLMMNDYLVTNTPLPNDSLKSGYITQVAGPGYDPEPNTMKWMFSKSKSANLAALSSTNSNSASIELHQTKHTLSWNDEAEIDEVLIFNTFGAITLKKQSPINKNIDISELQSGVYLVKFKGKNFNFGTKKIIIQ